MRKTKTQISLRIRAVWSASLPLASFYDHADQFESYLAENPEDKFSCDEAQIL